MKLGIRGQLTDVITCVKYLDDRFRGYGVLIPPKLPFPIDLMRRPYNSVALLCDTVISENLLSRFIYGRDVIGANCVEQHRPENGKMKCFYYYNYYYYNRTQHSKPLR